MSVDTDYARDGFALLDLAGWVEGLRFEMLSDEAVASAKRFWLDSLGCALGGLGTEDAAILLEHYRAMNPGGGPCRVVGSGVSMNAVDAAFLNSHLIRAMDYNDIYWRADPAHPSDLLGGPLSICESLGASGVDLLVATAVVYELQCRFAEIGRPGLREYGWHHATLSGFAAGLACGKALGLDASRLAHAAGICASRTGTLGAVTAGALTMMKNTVDPWASRMGAESALLASRGFTGPAHIIDGKEGLFHTFGHARCDGRACGFDAGGLTRGLPAGPSDPWRVSDVSFKTFPVEALMHTPLSALMGVRPAVAGRIGEIEEIRVEVIARAADILGDPSKYRPTTRETADHSLPYAMAVGLVDGAVTPAQFHAERVADRSLRPVMDLVRVVPNAAFDARFPASQPARVTVRLRDGSEQSSEVEHPLGDPRNPVSEAALLAKFRSLAEPVVGAARAARLAEMIGSLEALEDVGALVSAAVA